MLCMCGKDCRHHKTTFFCLLWMYIFNLPFWVGRLYNNPLEKKTPANHLLYHLENNTISPLQHILMAECLDIYLPQFVCVYIYITRWCLPHLYISPCCWMGGCFLPFFIGTFFDRHNIFFLFAISSVKAGPHRTDFGAGGCKK